MSVGMRVKVDTSGIAGVVSAAKARGITLKGVRAGAKVLQPVARAGAPRRRGSGALKQSQGVKAAKGRKGTTIAYAVQGAKTATVKMVKPPGYKTPQKAVPAFYDHLVMGGTKPHRLGKGESIGRAAVGRRKARAATSQATGGMHPGSKANPYRKRAYESVKNEVGEAAKKAMADDLQKVIAREAAKMKRVT